MAYKEMGYLPEAVVNYLVRLGWSYGDQEEFTLSELIEKFSLDAIGKSPASINPGKLDWLNSQYIKKMDLDELVQRVLPFMERKGYPIADQNLLRKIVSSLKERVKTLVEMAELSSFYFREDIDYDENGFKKFLKAETVPLFQEIIASLSKEDMLDKNNVQNMIRRISENRKEPLVKVAQPLRVALTGKTASPPIDEVIEALGKERVIRRLERAIEFIRGFNQ
jgi:glutamyl-tRNA synthetase